MRHHDARQFSISDNKPSPTRHVDVRSYMHTPITDLQAKTADRNPQKIGITTFVSRKPRTLPETPKGRDAVQLVLRSDKANYGFSDAPAPKRCVIDPASLADERELFINSLRARPNTSNLSRRHSSSTSDLSQAHTSTVFERLASPKNFCGMQRQRFDANGTGLGLDGSREDTTTAELVAGRGVILRGTSSVCASKIKDPHSDYAPPKTSTRPSTSTANSALFDRLSTPKKTFECDYDRTQKIHKRFGSASQLIF